MLEEDVVRVADVSCVGVEVVGGDAVPGWFHAAVGGDWGVDALGPLGGGDSIDIMDLAQFCAQVMFGVL